MVVKAIINAIGKAKPKVSDGTKFKRNQVDTLLEETQGKVDKINAGKLELDRKKYYQYLRMSFLLELQMSLQLYLLML